MPEKTTSLARAAAGACTFVLLAAVAAGLVARGNYAQTAYSALVLPFALSDHLGQGLLPCSSFLKQSIEREKSDNVQEVDADVAGWRMVTVKNPARPGRFRVKIHTVRREAVFYPRVGKGGLVAVFTDYRYWGRNKLFQLSGKDAWTDIGTMYTLDLRCVDYGWDKADFPADLDFVLTGAASQVWFRDDKVIY